jgi:hypothetical protein
MAINELYSDDLMVSTLVEPLCFFRSIGFRELKIGSQDLGHLMRQIDYFFSCKRSTVARNNRWHIHR